MKATYSPSQFLHEHPEVTDPRRIITDDEHYQRWCGVRMALVQDAYEAARKAVSWRGFNVGCVVYAWRPYVEAEGLWLPAEDPWDYLGVRWKTFVGANVKPEEDIRPICAEQIAVNSARMAGYTRIIGLVVVGEPQADNGSGLVHKTLHPCVHCRRTFSALPEIRNDTRILTGGLDRDDEGDVIHLEEFSFAELLEIHKTKV